MELGRRGGVSVRARPSASGADHRVKSRQSHWSATGLGGSRLRSVLKPYRMPFVGIAQPEEFREATRSHVIAWCDNLARRLLKGKTIRSAWPPLLQLVHGLASPYLPRSVGLTCRGMVTETGLQTRHGVPSKRLK